MTSLETMPRRGAKRIQRADVGRPSKRPPLARPLSPLGLVVLSVVFGLFTGGLELLQWLIRNAATGGVSLGGFQMSRHFVWMIPAADLAIFGAAGLVLALFGCFRPRPAARAGLFVFGFLAALSILLTVPGLYAAAAATLAAGIGVLTSRRFEARPAVGWRVLGGATLLVGVSAVGMARRDVSQGKLSTGPNPRLPAVQAPADAPNVVLMVLDTVRAESLSLYGYDRDTAPNLARLSSRAVRFDQARSTAPWTLPSHASMFTGRWPHELSVGEDQPLDTTYPTLAAYFSERGYATGGFIANTFFCNAWFGLGRGFEHYDDFYEEQMAVSAAETLRCSSLGRLLVRLVDEPFGGARRRKDASQINRAFLSWLDGPGGRPFFAFLNYFDAHTPYILPPGAEHRFGRPPRTDAEAATLQGWDARSRTSVTDAELTLTRDAYDDGVAYLDAEIGKLFDELERRGRLDDTLVIVTSDHGENHGEHGLIGHGRSLYDQEVRVPLLVFLPGGARGGEVVREPVSLRDLPATAVDLARLGDASPFPGSSLARFWSSDAEAEVPVLTEVRLRDQISRNRNRPPAWRGPMQAVVAEGRTYIRNADGQEELYDYREDPAQLYDQADLTDSDALLQRMRSRLRDLAPDAEKAE